MKMPYTETKWESVLFNVPTAMNRSFLIFIHRTVNCWHYSHVITARIWQHHQLISLPLQIAHRCTEFQPPLFILCIQFLFCSLHRQRPCCGTFSFAITIRCLWTYEHHELSLRNVRSKFPTAGIYCCFCSDTHGCSFIPVMGLENGPRYMNPRDSDPTREMAWSSLSRHVQAAEVLRQGDSPTSFWRIQCVGTATETLSFT
jgi:hypothetical protein